MTGARTPRALFRGRNVECDTSGDRRQATSDRRQHTLALYLARSLTRSFKSRKLPLPVDQSQTAMEKKKIGDRHKGDLELLAGRLVVGGGECRRRESLRRRRAVDRDGCKGGGGEGK